MTEVFLVPLTGQMTTADGRSITLDTVSRLTIVTPDPPSWGPRVPVGPDVPLSAAELGALSPAVHVMVLTDAGISQACQAAVQQGKKAVFLPAGLYVCSQPIHVPDGLTLYGEGSGTWIQGAGPETELLFAGNNTRFTRLRLLGMPAGIWYDNVKQTNRTRGIECWGKTGVTIDHCEFSGFSYSTLFMQGGQGEVHACSIHDASVIGFGYGVALASGGQATISDCEFATCRHAVTASGNQPTEHYAPTDYDVLYCHFHTPAPSPYQQASVDTHSSFNGSVRIEGNDWVDHPTEAIGLLAGSGSIQLNRFGAVPTGIRCRSVAEGGLTSAVKGLVIAGNTFLPSCGLAYLLETGSSITVDGKPVTPPYRVITGNTLDLTPVTPPYKGGAP